VAADHDIEVAELEAIVRREQEVFKRWFTRCEIRLRLSLRSFAKTVDVEAIVQEAAIRVWQRASTVTPDGRTGFLLRWAITVARNNARNDVKRAGHRLPDDPSRKVQDPADIMPDLKLRGRIQHCLSELRPNPRRTLDARRSDDGQHSDRELAASTGMTFDTFRKNLERGRSALKQCLRRFGIDVAEYLR
jgi:RNA polymerase sigma factor (sigma-70 family)